MKTCTSCKQVLPTTQFGSKSWTNKDGSKTSTKRSQCRTCINRSNLLRYHKNPSTRAAHASASYRHRIKSYGLTHEEFDAMLNEQCGGCAICGDIPDRKLNIDHDHNTGQIRALLCPPCNNALGFAKDDPDLLRKMADYLEKHSGCDSI